MAVDAGDGGYPLAFVATHGPPISFAPAHQLLRDVWVDGFFAISGFLITWSWFRRPRLRDYFVARGLRILPGLWVCLIVIAFVIAPLGVAIQGGSALKLLLSRAPFEYVLGNSAVVTLKHDIGGTPLGIPWPGQWDGSLWTLFFEVSCYIAIAVYGVLGLLRRRWFIPAALALALFCSAQLPPLSGSVEEPSSGNQHVDGATVALVVGEVTARFAVMFLAGALLYQCRNVIPARWSLVAVSVVIVARFEPVAQLPVGRRHSAGVRHHRFGRPIHNKRLRLRTDLSYGVYIYAWPVQQLLVICGLAV